MGAYLFLAGALAPVVIAAPPPVVKNLTVVQLDQLLIQMHGQSDARVAREITGVHLTERASAVRLARWVTVVVGDRSRQAVTVVADSSTLLAPPAAEMSTMPAPDAQTQRQILARCRDYVNQRIPKLPNYFALRTTTSFEFTTADRLKSKPVDSGWLQTKPAEKFNNRALGPAKSSDSPDPQYFWLGTIAHEVTYRGETEVADAAPGAKSQSGSSPFAVTTRGDFGSVLRLIVVDFSDDQIAWDHWEQGAQGSPAVFRYSVERERSHFAVNYWDGKPELPAYHGEVAIDPESGAVWRITILASASSSNFVDDSSLLVEFAPTEIAGVTYICPVHSVAIIRFFDTFEYANTAHTPVPTQISINDVAFTNYHQFRSESHIVSGPPRP